MHLRLHKNATTTPRIRAEIQVSKEPMRVLAQRFGVSVSTIARWKKRASVHDASHTPSSTANHADAGPGVHRARLA